MTKKTNRWPLHEIADEVITNTVFWNDDACPFSAQLFPGDERVLFISGENASGKSLLFRFISVVAQREYKLLPVASSIRERVEGGMKRAFMYGQENEQSTGATSLGVMLGVFHNAGRETPGLAMLDEPELGLSDGYARAMGEYIGHVVAKDAFGGLQKDCRGVVIVSHSRVLAHGLCDVLGGAPTFVNMDSPTRGFDVWLGQPEVRTIWDLMRLKEIGLERRRATWKLLDGSKAKGPRAKETWNDAEIEDGV